jgi:hypothetical protein
MSSGPGTRITSRTTVSHPVANGRRLRVERLTWNDIEDLSYEVYDDMTGACLTEDGAYDDMPGAEALDYLAYVADMTELETRVRSGPHRDDPRAWK